MTIGTQIRSHRQRLGLSQAALAEQLHVSRQTISNWETAKTLPDIYSLIALSDLFAVSLDDFIKGDAALQHHLDPQRESTTWFVASSSLIGGMTALVNGPIAWDLDLRVRMVLIIGQLLFNLFVLVHGRHFARSFIDRDTAGATIITGRFVTWWLYMMVALCTAVSIFAAVWTITY